MQFRLSVEAAFKRILSYQVLVASATPAISGAAGGKTQALRGGARPKFVMALEELVVSPISPVGTGWTAGCGRLMG